MNSRWNDSEAAQYPGDLGQRVYSSRLLGRDSALVLHGGGNTSVKIREKNIFGEEEDILYVKGSGWDLETIEAAGFSPCRLNHLLKLAKLPELTDLQMANELKGCMTNSAAPMASVEAILHAILPGKFVDHTHADALISITNTATGLNRVQEVYGDRVVFIPYVMPGFKLARLVAELFPQKAMSKTIGLVLMNHGLFTFGDTAKVAYERMIDLVTLAESYLAKNKALELKSPAPTPGAASRPSRDRRAAQGNLRRHGWTRDSRRARHRRRPRVRPPQRCGHDLAAGTGYTRSRHSHQADPDAGPRRGGVPRRLPNLF